MLIRGEVEICNKQQKMFNMYHSWVIIGAETGNRKGKVIPKKEWIESIVASCIENNVPIFMKNSLKEIWGEELIQEFPKELTNDTKI